MKIKIHFTLIFLLALASAFTFSACNKNNNSSGCTNYRETTYNIASLERQVIPYKGNDTIKLLNVTLNQTAIFIGKGFDTIYTKVDESNDPGCPWTNVAKRQSIQTTYTSVNYSLPLIIKQSLLYGDDGSYIVINFNNSEFLRGSGTLRPPYDLDSLVLGNKTYRNIRFLYLNLNSQFTDMVYYNVQNGIIKIISNGQEWNLLQ
ncbi:MAG: hypothetical protein ACHQK8_01830 [Bacteroidia bacterium]